MCAHVFVIRVAMEGEKDGRYHSKNCEGKIIIQIGILILSAETIRCYLFIL
jgi:hypothetical protein